MSGDDWSAETTALGAWISSVSEDVVVLTNATALDLAFSFPALLVSRAKDLLAVVDTRSARVPFSDTSSRSDRPYAVGARSFAFLRTGK